MTFEFFENADLFVAFKLLIFPPFIVATLLLTKLQPEFSAYECIWASFPVGYILLSWLSYLVSCIVGETTAFSIRFTYTLITPLFIYAVILWKRNYAQLRKQVIKELFQEVKLNILILLSSIYFGFIFYTHILYKDAYNNLWSGGSIWSDLGFHLNVINTFLFGKNKEISFFKQPVSVIFDGHPLSYPFIPDYHSASLIASGAFTTRTSILIPSFLIMISLIVLLFCFIRRVLRNFQIYTPKIDDNELKRDDNLSLKSKATKYIPSYDSEAFLGVCLWLFSGGIGGWTMLWDRPFTWTEIINEDWMQKTSSGVELYWFSCICHVLLPQRSAMFAYPLALLVFSSIFIAFNQKVSDEKKKTLFQLSGLLTGLLPLVHAHSFLSVVVILFVYALIEWRKSFNITKNGYFWLWFSFACFILIEALPQIVMYKSRLLGGEGEEKGPSFISFHPLWRNHPWANYLSHDSILPIDFNFVLLWWKALGFMVPLALLSTFILNSTQRKIIFCFWIIFVMANFIQFQPWDKDNNKIFLIWLMLPAGAVAALLLRWWRKNLLFKLTVIILIFSLVISGVLIALRETDLWWQYMDHEDQQFAEWIKRNTENDAVFLINESHIHPITNLAGRSVIFNFAGWISSHGYPNWWQRQSDVRILVSGKAPSQMWKHYNVSYVVIDWRLTHDYPVNRNFFDANPLINRIYNTPKYSVYDVKNLS